MPSGAKVFLAGPGPNSPRIGYPQSNVKAPGFAHTNLKMLIPPEGYQGAARPNGQPVAGFLGETPASIACIYRMVAVTPGCNPNTVTANASGGSRAIALVDAYDYVNAASDLAAFSTQFGLPAPGANFQVIYGTGSPANGCVSGTKPPSGSGTGWDIEAALDIEWAHSMAPNAKIYLVEANSNSTDDLGNAVEVATKCVQQAGGGQVSMSFGSLEIQAETSYDSIFNAANVVFFASAGDAPGVIYPAASPNVIGVGGTTISRDQNTGAFQSEAVWNDVYENTYSSGSGTGGGPSAYEPRPSYQNAIESIVGSVRGTPDLAAVADPFTGAWVYNTTYQHGWGIWGGTSLASPVVAGIVNAQGLFVANGAALLTEVYALGSQGKLGAYVTPVTSGLCGPKGTAGGFGAGYDPQWIQATTGFSWNWCTGWGSPRGPH
jgi:subtilase family serine protease